MSKKLAQIEVKKIMAYKKNPKNTSEYLNVICLKCKKEYLTQGIILNELDFCPLHTDYKCCNGCDEPFDGEKLKEDFDGEYYCKNCFRKKCENCNEDVEEDGGRFCSKSCYQEFFSELDD